MTKATALAALLALAACGNSDLQAEQEAWRRVVDHAVSKAAAYESCLANGDIPFTQEAGTTFYGRDSRAVAEHKAQCSTAHNPEPEASIRLAEYRAACLRCAIAERCAANLDSNKRALRWADNPHVARYMFACEK
jgi:hypothetical protein